MDWIRNNPVLSGLIGLTALGCGLLGFLLITAQGKYATVKEAFDREAAELGRLQALKPYPEQANLDQIVAQKAEYEQQTIRLLESLSKMELPVEPMTPEQFQDKLKRAVTELETKAAGAGMKLPENFFMGFDEYRTQLPSKEAAPLLGRQMTIAEKLCLLMVESKVAELKELKRDPLAMEGGAAKGGQEKKTAAEEKKTAAKPGDKTAAARPPMFEEAGFEMVFVAEQNRFRRMLNLVSSAKVQFAVVRSLSIANENPKSPSRIQPAEAASPVAAAPAQPLFGETGVPQAEGAAPAPSAPKMEFLLGNERVEVKMRVGAIDFLDPAAAAAARSGSAKQGKTDQPAEAKR